MKSEILNVLIVGCGNIAGVLDMSRPDNANPITHAGAFSKNPNFKILGCIDIDKEKALNFAKYWKIPNIYSSFEEVLLDSKKYDVISLCSPTKSHFKDIKKCLSLSPRLIFCEKPVTEEVTNTRKIKALCEKEDILFAVNHNRRWDERIITLKEEIEIGKRGSLRSVVGYYNKGILNNGSHLIDLLNFLIGNMQIQHVGLADYDFFSNDPSINVMLETDSKVPVMLVTGCKATDFSLFEIQFIFETGMLTILDGGMRWSERRVIDSKIFENYKELDLGVDSEGGYLDTMSNAVDGIWRAITNDETLNSTIDNALTAQTICEKILAKSTS